MDKAWHCSICGYDNSDADKPNPLWEHMWHFGKDQTLCPICAQAVKEASAKTIKELRKRDR